MSENLSMYKGFDKIVKAKILSIDDPLKRGRVQIYIPCYHGVFNAGKSAENTAKSQYPWAQVVNQTPVAQGLPVISTVGVPGVDVGQWVWVGFEGGDSRTPIYLGSVDIVDPRYDYCTGTQTQMIELYTVIEAWTDITKLINYNKHFIGLKNDGTVVAAGDNTFKQCDVSNWADISNIYTHKTHTVGLKSDGTVVATGNNSFFQCEVLDWVDISSIMIGEYYTIGFVSDGTIVMTHKEMLT